MAGWLSSTASGAEEEPWCLEPANMESWYNDNIQEGTDRFDRDCREAVDTVVRWMQQNCAARPELFDVSEIIKGGSLGKGTMVKDLSDVDLVALINPPHLHPIDVSPLQRYRDELQVVINDLKNTVSRLSHVKIIRSDAYLVNFTIEVGSGPRCIHVDLLPTAENVSGRTLDEVFEAMLTTTPYDMEFYSASLVKYQRDFVRNQPGYVKELIRLVKYWAYTKLPKELQKSYPLELITIHRWEQARSPRQFQKVQGLKDVLQVLTELSSLRHYWVTYYGSNMAENSILELRHEKPILLDPANPTNNACWVYQKGNNMRLVVDAARSTLNSTLLRGVVVHANWRD